MRGYTTSERINYWLFADRIPLTKILIISNVATFIAVVLFKLGIITNLLIFKTNNAFLMPWTLVTYPMVYVGDIIGLLFSAYWLWVAGGSLERSWTTRRFGIYFFLMCIISAGGIWVGSFLLNTPMMVVGLWLPLAGVTVAWAMLNPEQQILFFFIIPMKLKYLALLDVALVLLTYGQIHLLMGLFALIGCAFSYWYIQPHDFGSNRGQVIRVRQGRSFFNKLNPFGWFKEKRDKDRLRRLFEDSFKDDDTRDR